MVYYFSYFFWEQKNHILNNSKGIFGDFMYPNTMESYMRKLQDLMNKFSANLTSVQNGTKNFEDIKPNVQDIRNELARMSNDIDALQPPSNLLTLHSTVKEGCENYLQGVSEFMKFYGDGNDEHFVTGGLKIQKGTELMYKASAMF